MFVFYGNRKLWQDVARMCSFSSSVDLWRNFITVGLRRFWSTYCTQGQIQRNLQPEFHQYNITFLRIYSLGVIKNMSTFLCSVGADLSFSGVCNCKLLQALSLGLNPPVSEVSGVELIDAVILRVFATFPISISAPVGPSLDTFLYCGEQEENNPKTGESSVSSVSSSNS